MWVEFRVNFETILSLLGVGLIAFAVVFRAISAVDSGVVKILVSTCAGLMVVLIVLIAVFLLTK